MQLAVCLQGTQLKLSLIYQQHGVQRTVYPPALPIPSGFPGCSLCTTSDQRCVLSVPPCIPSVYYHHLLFLPDSFVCLHACWGYLTRSPTLPSVGFAVPHHFSAFIFTAPWARWFLFQWRAMNGIRSCRISSSRALNWLQTSYLLSEGPDYRSHFPFNICLRLRELCFAGATGSEAVV